MWPNALSEYLSSALLRAIYLLKTCLPTNNLELLLIIG
ncbi:hypothetical protein Y11_20341 [Yersinia enterocolitica subsp. palearctica Y11]|uniref:Uncharacterized protein n=2 Tax=Yersinia enterocolitica TaxID=630 RepID=A0A0H3NP01_YERE1|nr:unknown protein [Yersinia enterocolitica W22703]CBY26147.1 hypothetical protein Y11_20341 [Yersinia enterocolitica subsp. palearctica Y11]CCO69637.1 hypothetical protein D322_2763 [Yersinia enterocolitica IP 10393]